MTSPGTTVRAVAIFLVVLLAQALVTPAAAAESSAPKVKILNASQVYYPSVCKKGTKYKKPAILTTSTIFDSISEWKQIKKKGLKKSDAEYHLLLKKANEKFNKALKKVQAAASYDIMAEVGAIETNGVTATDVTQTVIANLPS